MRHSAQILLEVLIAVAITALVVGLGSQLIYVGLVSNELSAQRNVAVGLLEEVFTAAGSVGTENWNALEALTHGSTAYYPATLTGAWTLTAGEEDVLLNDITYTRSFTIQNVCRDLSTSAIRGVTDSGGTTLLCTELPGSRFDASTKKITATLSWEGVDPLVETEYITRWRNKVCTQTSWTSAGSGVGACPATTYGSKSNITSGTSLQLCPGGC